MKIGIIGVGMVGGTIRTYFEKKGFEVLSYDPAKKFFDDLSKAQLIFICVPTDNHKTGVFDLTNIKQALELCANDDYLVRPIVIKSTLLPGTCKQLQEEFPRLDILYNPEFLTEANAQELFENPQLQIIGCKKNMQIVAKQVLGFLPAAKTSAVTLWETAESVKIVRNTLSACKVVLLNEIYDSLEKAGIKYEDTGSFSIKDGLEELEKIPSRHLTVVHKGGRGAGGKCLKKDLKAFASWSNNHIIEKIEKRNINLLKQYPKL